MRKVLITLAVFVGMASAIPAAYFINKSTKDNIVACGDKDADSSQGGQQGTES
ncbi:MAG: hypothetical protein ACRENF_00170 [Thermodesulfobacteriota bacterium]